MRDDRSSERDPGEDAPRATQPLVSSSLYIPTLDGWRAIAVGLVIGAHSARMLERNGSWLALHLESFFIHAGYGVDIFFGISGFLICTLLLREKEKNGRISFKRFYIRRAFRIMPPLYFYLLIIFFLSLLSILPSMSTMTVLSVIFFFRNYLDAGWYTGHFWSLSIEEHFYLIAPLLIASLSRSRAMLALLGLAILCVLIRYYEFSHHMFGDTLLQFRTENRCDGLLWGALWAHLLHSKSCADRIRQFLSPVLLLVLLIATVVSLALVDATPFRRTLVALVIPFVLAYTMLNPDSLFGRFLESAPLRFAGRMSYSIYLWQMPFLRAKPRLFSFFQPIPWAYLFIAACAIFSYYIIEKPMIRLGHKLACMMTRVAHEKALPFDPLIPNEETIVAMKEAREERHKTITVDILQADIDANE